MVTVTTLSGVEIAVLIFIALLIYTYYVRLQRFRRFKLLQQAAAKSLEIRKTDSKGKEEERKKESQCFPPFPNTILEHPSNVHAMFYALTLCECEFETWCSMTFRGLFHTYAIPSISKVLQSTNGFQKDTDRRYADMELLIREFIENSTVDLGDENGHLSRARISLLRINTIHNHYGKKILYRDMFYVLVIFMTCSAEVNFVL